MKKFWSYLKGWRGLLLSAYMWLILMAYVIVYVDISSPELKKRFYWLSVAEVILIAVLCICPRLLRWAESISITPEHEHNERKFFLHSWLAVFGVFLVMYIIFYPGGLSSDNVSQYAQAIGASRYNDHHPVFQTLFAITLPLKLSGGWFGSVNLFQLTLFSIVIAYMASTVLKYSNLKYAKRFLIYIMLNPYTLRMSIVPLKDTSFAIAALLMMTFAARVYFSHGEWMNRISHMIFFAVVMTSCTLFRHNAILFTLPLWFAVSLFIKKRHALILLVSFLAMMYAVKYPLYDYLNVQRPTNNRQIEMLGLPMNIIGNAVKEAHERLDSEVLEFAYSVAPQEVWDKFYDVFKGWQRIKFASNATEGDERAEFASQIDTQAIERTGWEKVLALTAKCFMKAPLESLRGALAVTNIVYGIAGAPSGLITLAIDKNKFGLSNSKSLSLSFLAPIIKKIVHSDVKEVYRFIEGDNFSVQTLFVIVSYAAILLFKHLFWHVGIINLVLIIFVLAKLKFNRLGDWKKLCFVLPVFMHNYGTMLLLTTQEFRFFYYSYLVLPIVLLVLLRNDGEAQS